MKYPLVGTQSVHQDKGVAQQRSKGKELDEELDDAIVENSHPVGEKRL